MSNPFQVDTPSVLEKDCLVNGLILFQRCGHRQVTFLLKAQFSLLENGNKNYLTGPCETKYQYVGERP